MSKYEYCWLSLNSYLYCLRAERKKARRPFNFDRLTSLLSSGKKPCICYHIVSCLKQINLVFLVESNEDTPLCPVCGSGMKLYDHRKRIMKQYDQDDEYVIVPRYRCLKNSCNKIHTALPSCLMPHKHYAVHIIEETIDEYNVEQHFIS